MMARYAILQVLLEAGDDFVTIVRGDKSQEGGKGTYVKLDKCKVWVMTVCPIVHRNIDCNGWHERHWCLFNENSSVQSHSWSARFF